MTLFLLQNNTISRSLGDVNSDNNDDGNCGNDRSGKEKTHWPNELVKTVIKFSHVIYACESATVTMLCIKIIIGVAASCYCYYRIREIP